MKCVCGFTMTRVPVKGYYKCLRCGKTRSFVNKSILDEVK